MSLTDDLEKVVKGEVLSDKATLATYSRDASLFVVPPKVVVFPKDAEDVKNLVRYVREKADLPIEARGKYFFASLKGLTKKPIVKKVKKARPKKKLKRHVKKQTKHTGDR